MQDTLAALEIDAALNAKGPELMRGLLQRRKLAMTFGLWDPQAHGYVIRAGLAAVLEFYYRYGLAPGSQTPLLRAEKHPWVLISPWQGHSAK